MMFANELKRSQRMKCYIERKTYEIKKKTNVLFDIGDRMTFNMDFLSTRLLFYALFRLNNVDHRRQYV